MTEHQSLRSLQQHTEIFINQIFDHVRSLGHTHLLGQLYDFQNSIETQIKITQQGERS